ncbi:hypothetical protein DFQ30_008241 [Apophysomyces sp. BC1015]|nr:hypothetical protein DFQ30_008241 [Apophysomyces sp. BC1015]
MGRPILPRMPEVLPSAEPVVSLESPTTAAATPAPVLGDREQRVSTIYPYEIPTQPTSRPLFETRKRKADDDPREYEYIKEKKIAIRQARYAARQAEFEALKAKHEEHKMEFAVRLAEVEKERDLLGLRKLELELEIVKLREKL